MSKKINWIRSFEEGSEKKYGGRAYNNSTYDVLKKNFDFSFYDVFEKGENSYFRILINSFINTLKINSYSDIWIRDYFSTIPLLFNKPKNKNIVFIQHIASTSNNSLVKAIFNFYTFFFYLALKKSDGVITISDYWHNHFRQKGIKNVYTVYPFLEFEKMNITQEDVINFKKKYSLNEKPIIYLGNCRSYKGVLESYEILKDLDVQLITSGTKEVDVPAIHLDLDYFDYLCLLKASSIVLFMSKFEEGWGLTAHEAMYLGTPVIGSGLGGNRELLLGGKQIVCDFSELQQEVIRLLESKDLRDQMSKYGNEFARLFDKERFENSWIQTINSILK